MQANDAEMYQHIVFITDHVTHNFKNDTSTDEIDLQLIYCDWLADPGTTSPITQMRPTPM